MHKMYLIITKKFPFPLDFLPNILIQLNCIYTDGINTKIQFLNQIKNRYEYCGKPLIYILEVIDNSFIEDHTIYPKFIRVSNIDIENTFNDCIVIGIDTYKYPENKSTKKMYIIVSKDFKY